MKFLTTLAAALAGASIANALSLPTSLAPRDSDVALWFKERAESFNNVLEKRKGGGRSGGFSSGGGRSGGSSSKPPANSLSTSNRGGSTSDGSGAPRTFGGGSFYSGGARVPYTAGKASPSGIHPTFLPGARVGAFYPGIWLYGAYAYSYPIRFHNVSRHNDSQTQQVSCLCQKYQVCGCDNNSKGNYARDLIGNGSYASLNKSLIKFGKWKGSTRLFLNGSLPNGTTAESFATGAQSLLAHASWGVVAAALTYSFWFA